MVPNIKFSKPQNHISAVAAAVACMLSTISAQAVQTIDFGNDKSVSIGFGMRTSLSSVQNGAPDGTNSDSFNVDSARLYLDASLNKYIKGMFNTEQKNGAISVMDMVAEFEIAPEVNIWAGQLISPSDRVNMAGPYYSLGGGYAGVIASRYGANGGITAARDDGVVVWGNLLDNHFLYSFGASNGYTLGLNTTGTTTYTPTSLAAAGGAKTSQNMMYASRLQYDFWDAEPGYYGTGNYLGTKDILAVGIAGRSQNDGVLTTTNGIGNYSSGNIDFLLEKKIEESGAISLEAAYYRYNTGNVILSEQGNSYLVGIGYIFKDKVGSGQFQPFARNQQFNADNNISTKQQDIGVNYIIDGYNAQVTATFTSLENSYSAGSWVSRINSFNLATQLQF